MPDFECPACGRTTTLEAISRTAEEFCRQTPDCDFPLFWSPAALARPADDLLLKTSLRRLPGTAGRVAVATIECPHCFEPNPVANIMCLRCDKLLRPEPEPEVFVQPEPEPVVVLPPPPPPAKAPIWPWILIGLLTVALLVWWAYQAWG